MKMIPSTKPYFDKRQTKFITSAQKEIFKSGRLILGPYTKMFEEKFAKYTGTKFAIATSSCSSALEICLRFLNVKNREVIVPTNTFVASANTVIFAGCKPVLADINRESLCLDVNDFKKKISKNTKAVIVVHIAGLIHPQIKSIKNICEKLNILLIEDVAHALGSSIDKQKAGSIGNAGCFSFYPTKIITTGTGGMITTNDGQLARYAISLRHHGAGKGLEDIQRLGNDWLMSEIAASLGIAQLKEIERFISIRRRLAGIYDRKMKEFNINRLQNFPESHHVYYKYPIILKTEETRNKLKAILKNQYGIETGSIYFPSVHQMPLYKKMYDFKKSDFVVADSVLPRVLSLPIFVSMTKTQQDYVINSLKKALNQ
ncbi:hypothetical protein A3G14_02535 [Candidatus Curtissbacteria bacterium RIFCSPLOWO2_12_FULL_38_9]|uniref:Aminotransferase DegT n=1 Tax=Candidatus Curtissbacteria bacterium RIFCSPLOWO2_12_FULL_38_9 TaxID=1797735 RepID=A0A1F5I964_9BACT|nr:MAG: hypothetical protein A3G14_02535 [Candidatus Curtissbacteria bacterium RIFCSPLOWO2_12_FULL_38_9]